MPNSPYFRNDKPLLRLVIAPLITAILLMGVLDSSPGHAAAGDAAFTLNPVTYDPSNPVTRSYFVLNASQGGTLQNEVRVTNSGTATGTVSLYAVDATTAQTSGLVYLNQNAVRRDVGAWITLGQQQLTLSPGQSQVVPFQVAIPSGAYAGQHVGGIAAENLAQQDAVTGEALQVKVRRRTVVAVQVNIAGTWIEQLAATGISSGGANNYQTLLVGLSNTGTVLLKPFGSLQVFDTQGHLLQDRTLQLDTFLPQTAITYPVYVQHKALGVGTYQAKLNLKYGHGHVLSYSTSFSITPQQVTKVFQGSSPLQPPNLGGNSFDNLSPWYYVAAIILLFLLVSGFLYWGQKLRHLTLTSQRRGTSKRAKTKIS